MYCKKIEEMNRIDKKKSKKIQNNCINCNNND